MGTSSALPLCLAPIIPPFASPTPLPNPQSGGGGVAAAVVVAGGDVCLIGRGGLLLQSPFHMLMFNTVGFRQTHTLTNPHTSRFRPPVYVNI